MGKRLIFGLLLLCISSPCWAEEVLPGAPPVLDHGADIQRVQPSGSVAEAENVQPPIDDRKELGQLSAEEPSNIEVEVGRPLSPVEKFFQEKINQPPETQSSEPNEPLPRTRVSESPRDLEQFGYGFFQGSLEQNNNVALVDAGYLLGPGDTLRIDLWGSLDGSHQVVVDRGGSVFLPKVGTVSVWGQTLQQAHERVQKKISKYYSGFDFSLSLSELRAIQVFLVGEVEKPGAYMVSGMSTLLMALNEAGGVSRRGSLRKIGLHRQGQADQVVDLYDLFLRGDRSGDVRLLAGDTIFVPIAGELVGVAGDVRRPAIYEIKEGDNLRTLLSMAGGVIPSGYLQKVQVQRIVAHEKKTVVDIDLSRADALGQSLQELVLQDRDMVVVEPISATGGYVTLGGYVVRPGEYQLLPGMRLSDLISQYDNLMPDFYPDLAQIIRISPPQYEPEIITVDLSRALQGDPTENLLLQEYDQVKLFSRLEMQEESEVKVSGAVQKPGSYKLLKNMTVKDLVAFAGNLKRRAFTDQAELTRFVSNKTGVSVHRQMINLKQALLGNPADNIVLQTDDHLFVRAIPDFNDPQSVSIQGEVLYPGTYAITKGETLSSVLERVGGYSKEAYLRGAVFSRESLRETQQKRLDKLIRDQEEEIARIASSIALGTTDKLSAERAAATLEFRQQLLKKMKETPVSGRMIVTLGPLDKLKGSEDDLILMDGDELTIPSNPRSVSVLGEVYNASSLAFSSGKGVGYYLAKVGGTTDRSNPDEMFIVRADGTVVSKAQAGSGVHWDQDLHQWSMSGFEGIELYPGDTVLVPEEFERLDLLSTVKDVTTILYQMALGAAAVASF